MSKNYPQPRWTILGLVFLGLLGSGQTRYRYERPSRVVEIKQGRLQGIQAELPLILPTPDSPQVRVYIKDFTSG